MPSLAHALALTLSLLASTALTHPNANLQPRQNTPDPASASAQFSSAAAQLISLYIPSTLAVPIGIAIQSAASAASVTGDINSIVESALTAPTPPPFLSALPTVYSSNVLSLESAISALRGAASTGVQGAPRVATVTGTDARGSPVTSTVLSSAAAAGNGTGSGAVLVLTLSNSLGSIYVSTTTEAVLTSAANATVTTTGSVAATVTSSQSALSSSTPPPSSSSAPPPSSSSKSAFAAPTQVPLAAAGVGVLGLVGLLAAL